MSLTLSSEDLTRFEKSLHSLLSPLEHSSTESWKQSCIHALRAVTGADKGFFWLADGSGGGAASLQGIGEEAIRDYADYYVALDLTGPLLRATEGAQVWNRVTVGQSLGLADAHYFGSELFNDWFHRHGMDAGVVAAVNDPARGVASFVPASLGYISLYHPRVDDERDDRSVRILRMLLPALRAGITTCVRLFEQRASFARALDELSEGLMLCDRAGVPLHLNAAATRMITTDPEGVRIREAMDATARALSALLSRPDGAALRAGPTLVRQVTTGLTSYRVRGSLITSEVLAPGAALLVAVERTTPELPNEEELRARFGLSHQEARVALRMAAGRSNDEIARELIISPSTARHHAEQVRAKIGVRSRAEIALVILRRSQ